MNKPARPRRFGQRPCPVCGEKMELVEKNRTEIEVCEAHGVWLDKGELEAIAAASMSRGRARGHVTGRRVGERTKTEEMKWLFGPLSFFFE